ncbi:PSI protein J (chloroplast) [Cucumis sativus]|uniref:PSI protein J n=1 Tax=Cucumis sativus TaxID=3659 RepID=UPI000052D4E8|nr:PSI protein J [Cucumis sativus]CAJ00778.1 PSI protein J [Cucumis sativus]
MRDLKTFSPVAPVVSTIWSGFSGSINRDQSFIPGCVGIPIFSILVLTGRGKKIRNQ